MTRSDGLITAAGAAAILALGAYSATHLRVSTDITHFLPVSEDQTLAKLSRELTRSPLARTMILSVRAGTQGEAIAGAQALAAALKGNPELAALRAHPPEGFAERTFDLLFPHRDQLLFDAPETQWPARLSERGVAAGAAALKARLSSPAGFLVERIVGRDPLLAFPALLDRLEQANSGGLAVVDGQFVTADGCCAIVFLETVHSAFDGSAQAPLLASIQAAFERVNQAHGGRLTLERSGLNLFAVDSERIVRKDIDRISGISTLALVLLFLVLFRSVRTLLLAFLPLITGMAAAVAASMAVFGEIHGLTLAFGSTLIGVCVDYPIHFLNHHSLLPAASGPRGTRRRIAWALALGAVTTLAGFAGLGWTSFPGMRELALFATVGICAALAATWWLLPALSARVPPRSALHQALAGAASRLLGRLQRGRLLPWLLPAAALATLLVGLPRVRWRDDPGLLNRLDDRLKQEDERVRAQVSRMDAGRLVLATGKDAAQALAANDRVYEVLAAARSAGHLQDFSSLHGLLFSPDLQRRNDAALRADPGAPARVVAGLAAAGFRPAAFAPFLRDMAQPPVAPLSLAEVSRSPLRDLVRPFVVDTGDGVGVVTLLRGVGAPDELRRALASIPGTSYFDQEEFLARTYGRYRRRTLEAVAAGLLVMFAIVFLKYRDVRRTLAAGVPALLAAATTLALLGLFGVVANLLNVVSLLFVVSAGEDYSVFLLESSAEPTYLPASAVSVALCCFATVLGFGLLGLSEMPALRAIGLTTGIGVVVALLLAPTALLFVRSRPVGSPR
ncbi:MAG: MMPL family transporter [Myxococcales bacterium]